MTQDDVKKIRVELELTQDELAIILGVTKAAITRYESKSEKTFSSPQGEIEKKLIHIKNLLLDPNDKKKLLKLRHSDGGVASLAGLIAVGAATFPIAMTSLSVIPIGLSILGLTASINNLGKFISSITKD